MGIVHAEELEEVVDDFEGKFAFLVVVDGLALRVLPEEAAFSVLG